METQNPRGFGHIGINSWWYIQGLREGLNVYGGGGLSKKPDDGVKMKGNSIYLRDPDGYWIEIFDL